MVLHRAHQGQPLARILLKREADQPQPDASYGLEAHLLKGSLILDRAQAHRRGEAFRKLLADLAKPKG